MITVTFLNGCILATAEQSLWQYSYNQQLQINGLELPGVFTVDFCNEGDTTTVAMIGSSGVVDIPNELLTSGRDIVAYVFQKSALTGGVTRCEIRIDVLTRPERDDETPTPEQEAVIDQYIAELNEGVEKANESAEDAEAWAVGERGGEPVSESDPTYENNAKYWAENISGQLEDYRTAADQDAIDSAQDGKINALTNLLNKKQSKITANGILKGDGNGGISAAVPGMDYLPTSALYAYRSAIKQDEIDNAQNANIAKNADDIADVKTTADTALQPAALAPYRTAADQDTIDNAQAADIAAINDKIPSTASKNNKLVAWSTFNGQLGTKQAKITANGILKGDGAGGVSAAVAGTDYLAPSALDAYRTAAAQDEIDAAQDEDIADVEAAVDQKAPIIINSASGDIAHFEDGADNMPVKQLSVNVEPIQDLHGYDSPWPAGGGKNKFNPAEAQNNKWINNTTIESISGFWITGFIPVKSGDVIRSALKGSARNAWYNADKSQATYFAFDGQGSATAPSDGFVVLTVSSSTVAYGSDFIVTINDADLTFSPYSNICHISGRTSATVTRTGKNLLPEPSAENAVKYNGSSLTVSNVTGGISVTGQTGESSHSVGYLFGKVDNYIGKPLTLSCKMSTVGGSPRAMILLCDENFQSRSDTYFFDATGSVTATFQTGKEGKYIGVAFFSTSGSDSASITSTYTDIQLELGSTASAYEPYQGNTYTIALGDTVYGGTLDVIAGKMVVDRAIVDLGTLDWKYFAQQDCFYSIGINGVINHAPFISSIYSNAVSSSVGGMVNGEALLNKNAVYVKDTRFTDATTFKTAVTGQQLVYELATPIEITLTPTQIETLLGQNNIWSDAGTVDVDYRADTKLYIDNIHQPTEDDMTADAQIASGKYFLVNGNLYKSTTVIPAGDTIIPGTNCIKTNLAEALNALNA